MTAEFWQYDARLGRRWNLDPKPQRAISDYACFANSPFQFSDLKGDSIRLTDAFKAQKQYMKAWDTWMSTESGKQFKKDYDKGGKYEHIAAVFDAVPTEKMNDSWASGETNSEIVDVKNPKNVTSLLKFQGAEENSISGAKQIVQGKVDDKYLRFTFQFPIPYGSYRSYDIASNVISFIHEKQHMQVNMLFLATGNTMPARGQGHDIMRVGIYSAEREKTFWTLGKLWSKEYVRQRGYQYINKNPFNFVDYEVNRYTR